MVKNNLAQSIGEPEMTTKRTIYPSARRGCGSEEDPKDEHEQHAIKLIRLLGKENDFAEDLARSLDTLDATFKRLLETELSPLKALKEVEFITNHAAKLGATELMRNAYRMLISIQNNKAGEFPELLKESHILFSQLKTRLQSVSALA